MASGLGVCSKKQTHVTKQQNTSELTNFWAHGQGRGDVPYWHKADIPSCTAHVRYWHLADIA
jgi:hypothetical protein